VRFAVMSTNNKYLPTYGCSPLLGWRIWRENSISESLVLIPPVGGMARSSWWQSNGKKSVEIGVIAVYY
jgi:hypothetical protein